MENLSPALMGEETLLWLHQHLQYISVHQGYGQHF